MSDRLQIWWHGGRSNRYPGNQWQKPLSEDELRILWHLLREVSFVWDFVSEYVPLKIKIMHEQNPSAPVDVQYHATKEPISQILRPLVRWITLI